VRWAAFLSTVGFILELLGFWLALRDVLRVSIRAGAFTHRDQTVSVPTVSSTGRAFGPTALEGEPDDLTDVRDQIEQQVKPLGDAEARQRAEYDALVRGALYENWAWRILGIGLFVLGALMQAAANVVAMYSTA
jgi:hypothetical protein